jgi:hypothetical protein
MSNRSGEARQMQRPGVALVPDQTHDCDKSDRSADDTELAPCGCSRRRGEW